jgi:LPXTG-site transpeptidase (sortase) family protein
MPCHSWSRCIKHFRLGPRRFVVSFVVSVVCLMAFLCGCSAKAPSGIPTSGNELPTGAPSAAPILEGRPAAIQAVEFIPERLVLPGKASAAVLPATTVDGVLKVPENVQHVGWWDGSAWAGEPFGSTVIAGHVDSASQGVGFFARLLKIKVGDTITLMADSHRLKYRVTSVKKVPKKALATDNQVLTQTGQHRLVLITCTGNYHRNRGGYDSNLVVVAKPSRSAR